MISYIVSLLMVYKRLRGEGVREGEKGGKREERGEGEEREP